MKRTLAGNSLVGILVSFMIIVVAVMFFVTGGFGMLGGEEERERADGLGQTTLGRARYAAEDSVCRTQLSQVRQLVDLSKDQVDEVYPAGLSQVSGLPAGYDKCPIGKEQYTYDPATGEVTCPHTGHEKY